MEGPRRLRAFKLQFRKRPADGLGFEGGMDASAHASPPETRGHMEQQHLTASIHQADALHSLLHFLEHAEIGGVARPYPESFGRLVRQPASKDGKIIPMIRRA